MRQLFSTVKKVVKEIREPFTHEQLSELIAREMPTEIWHSQWSSKMPFIVITEYNKKGFMMYCNGEADKTPRQFNAAKLYSFLHSQGLSDCYINDRWLNKEPNAQASVASKAEESSQR